MPPHTQSIKIFKEINFILLIITQNSTLRIRPELSEAALLLFILIILIFIFFIIGIRAPNLHPPPSTGLLPGRQIEDPIEEPAPFEGPHHDRYPTIDGLI